MLKLEKRLIEWCDRHKDILLMIVFILAALVLRFHGRDYYTGDFVNCLKVWYETIIENGGLAGLGTQVGDYNVAYQILLAFMGYIPLDVLYQIKIVSAFFDFVLAIGLSALAGEVYMQITSRTARDKQVRSLRCLVLGVALCVPTVFLNSSYWAQCDAIYASFAVLALLYLFREKHFRAFLFLALSFTMKLQSVFIIPFFLIEYAVRRRYTLLWFLLLPVPSILLAVLCGRAPLAVFDIYLNQTGETGFMWLNFPNLWTLVVPYFDSMNSVNREWWIGVDYLMLNQVAQILTVLIFGLVLRAALINRERYTGNALLRLRLLCWSVWSCVMFLPCMHDRYAYLAEMLMLVLALIDHRETGCFVLLETLALMCYFAVFRSHGSPNMETWVYLIMAGVNLAAYTGFTRRVFFTESGLVPQKS